MLRATNANMNSMRRMPNAKLRDAAQLVRGPLIGMATSRPLRSTSAFIMRRRQRIRSTKERNAGGQLSRQQDQSLLWPFQKGGFARRGETRNGTGCFRENAADESNNALWTTEGPNPRRNNCLLRLGTSAGGRATNPLDAYPLITPPILGFELRCVKTSFSPPS